MSEKPLVGAAHDGERRVTAEPHRWPVPRPRALAENPARTADARLR